MSKPPIRKKKFKPEEVEKAIEAYFARCKKNSETITVTGLALGIGFCSRQMLSEYEADPAYGDLIKKARLVVENRREVDMLNGKNIAANIFALKNMGWRDGRELQPEVDGEVPAKALEHFRMLLGKSDAPDKA